MMKVNSTKELDAFSDVKASQLALMHYTKTACGVDFLLNTADSTEKTVVLFREAVYDRLLRVLLL